jgi:hypothetical protein
MQQRMKQTKVTAGDAGDCGNGLGIRKVHNPKSL